MNRSTFIGSGMALTGAGLLSSCSTQLAYPAIATASPQTLDLVRPNVLTAIEGYQEAGRNDLFWSQYAKTSAPTLIVPKTIWSWPGSVDTFRLAEKGPRMARKHPKAYPPEFRQEDRRARASWAAAGRPGARSQSCAANGAELDQ